MRGAIIRLIRFQSPTVIGMTGCMLRTFWSWSYGPTLKLVLFWKGTEMSTEVRVPTLGESVTEATVATWFKKPGDAVAVDEMLCELETDKVSVEVPAPASGTLSEILAGEGDTVQANGKLMESALRCQDKSVP